MSSTMTQARPHPNGAKEASGVLRFRGLTTTWEFITPELAEQYLTRNTNNRNEMKKVTARYSSDVSSGKWVEEIHVGIGFHADGSFVDGQHRLKSIVKSGKGLWMMVTRGMGDEARLVVDKGKGRSLSQSLKMLGFGHSDNQTVGVAKMMALGKLLQHGLFSDSTMMQFIEDNIEAIVYANKSCKRFPCAVRGAIGRAYYHIDQEKLDAFCRVLDSGEGDFDGAKGIRMLRDNLMRNRQYGGSQRVGIYLRVENSILKFSENTPVSRLHEAADELFPLPKDKEVKIISDEE